ncbi:MAG: UTP--glucose-1-phosphate uridylyltransferase [Pseudomonadota bacterium]
MITDKVRTAIFPVAGLGTRFLPATKATPKELLPVIDKPLIQFAIDEARACGVERLIFVNHPSKPSIEKYVREDVQLVEHLRKKGKLSQAIELEKNALRAPDDDVIFVTQDKQLGLGHAVLCAAEHVLPGPVAVLLPDDLIVGQEPCLAELVDAYEETGCGHMVATMTVAREETSRYGVLSITQSDKAVLHADAIVEKPAPDIAPSCEAVVGRYVLSPQIFETLRSQTPGAGGEIQLTDAIARDIGDIGLAGFRFSGQRFDCGSKAGMLQATLHLAMRSPEYSSALGQVQAVSASIQAA